uniref:ZM domain-containing protein n=1 Tax=Strongyloides papillosus TaxID=174720 RepID=A0A0N5C1Z9_STREA
MPQHRRKVRSQSRGRWSVNLKVSVTTEGPNNGLIIQQGLIPQSSYGNISLPDFNSLPTYSFNPTQPNIEMLPSTSVDNLNTSIQSLNSPKPRSVSEEPLHIQTSPSPVIVNNHPVQVQNNKSTTLTTVEVFRAPIDEEVQFYKLPPEPVSITGQPQYIRAHGPAYETWNHVRTETLIDDPAPIIVSKSVQWKNDLEERLTVSSYDSYNDDLGSVTREEIEYNDTPPKVYGLNKRSDPYGKQSISSDYNYPLPEPSPIHYHVSSPTASSAYTENRSQSPMVAHILRQQKIIQTESTPINGRKVNGNERILETNGYREGDLQIKPLTIDVDGKYLQNNKNNLSLDNQFFVSPSSSIKSGKPLVPRGRSPSILKNGSSRTNRSRSPSWEEYNRSDLYKTKDVLGNVIDLV